MKKMCSLIGFVLSFSILIFGQEADKVIEFPPAQPEAGIVKIENGKFAATDAKGVELVGISVEGKEVTIGEPFVASEDWLKTLAVKLKNASGKIISSLRISFAEPEAKHDGKISGFTLAFGSLSPMFDESRANKLIQPGEEFTLTQTEKHYLINKNFTADRTGVTNIRKVIIGMTMVKFEDGETWAAWKIPTAK